MTSNNAIPRLLDTPRTETQLYRFPPARPCAPPAEQCTDADLRRLLGESLANHSDLLALLGSPDHVRRILAFAEHTTAELIGERMESVRLARLHAELSRQMSEVLRLYRALVAENIELRRRLTLDTEFDRAARALTGQCAADLDADLAEQTLRFPMQFDDDTVVVDGVA